MHATILLVAFAARACVASLESICNTNFVKSTLPSDGLPSGVTIDLDSVTAVIAYNVSATDSIWYPDGIINYCNVTFAYSHHVADDRFVVYYWLPSPDKYSNRFLATGGGAYSINSRGSDAAQGIMHGATTGYTDGGFPYWGGSSFDEVVLLGSGTVRWEAVYSFGYRAIMELTQIGKEFSKNFFAGTSNATKVWTYYSGCSEGGREGMSQAQRAGDLYDGIIVGAPAMRYSQQQVNHLSMVVQEITSGYYPPTCELDKIVNETIKACDGFDGLKDGVVARSDLCALNFNISSLIGTAYYCAEETTTSIGLGYGKRQLGEGTTSTTPAQNGTISVAGAALAQVILDGLMDADGRQVYFPYLATAGFNDAKTTWNNTTGSWEPDTPNSNGAWITRFLEWQDVDELDLTNVTYDNLRDYMIQGMELYTDSLQTTLPDLTPFMEHGGRILHWHGEADASVPTAGSIHYHESVRKIMYPVQDFDAGNEALNEWYRLFIVPGAAHCATYDLQPSAPFPQTNLAVMIDWVENGETPDTLNATVLSGDTAGDNGQICAWPARPYWGEDGIMVCQGNETSISALLFVLDAFKMPIY